MQHHFDYRSFPGINYKVKNQEKLQKHELNYEQNRVSLVKDLSESLQEFNVKLAASFARIRIENNASGSSLKEQMLNILSPEVQMKEQIAIEMSKSFRINFSKTSLQGVEESLERIGIYFSSSQPVSELE